MQVKIKFRCQSVILLIIESSTVNRHRHSRGSHDADILSQPGLQPPSQNKGRLRHPFGARMRIDLEMVGAMRSVLTTVEIRSGFTPEP